LNADEIILHMVESVYSLEVMSCVPKISKELKLRSKMVVAIRCIDETVLHNTQ